MRGRVSSILMMVVALCGAGFEAPGQVEAQVDFFKLFGPIAIAVDKFVSLIQLERPDSSFPEQLQHKGQALSDHTNDVSYRSTSQEIIERSGFKQVTHHVISPDGYITELINVIDPQADQSQLKWPPVVIFHGGLTDTNTWLWASAIEHHPEKYPRSAEDGPITSSNRSLGMMLTNYGYNVWLVATRGSNKNNIGHVSLKTKLLEDILLEPADLEAPREILDTIEFYNFSQDELVELEYPAQIERICNLTGSSKISVITYSFSTQIMFKILASNEQLASRIHSNVVLEPILDRVGMNSLVNGILDFAMVFPVPAGNFLQQLVLSRFTRDILRLLDRYSLTYFLETQLVGPSPRYQTFLEDPLIGHVLQPTSFLEFRQYGQQTLLSVLQKLDHGPVRNLELYGQATPPIYSIPSIRMKRWMMVSGDTDTLGTQSSADKYLALIPAKPYRYIRRVNGWDHLDTVAAFENDLIVNLAVLDFFDTFSSRDRAQIDQAD